MYEFKMEERVSDLRLEIVRTIKHAGVLQFMVPCIIDQAHGADIKRLYSTNPERATHRMLDLIIKSDQPGKWTAFIDALKHCEYPYVVTLLSSDTRCYNHQRKILELFAPFLEQLLDPREVVDKLYALDIIDISDVEEILAEQNNNGSILATMLLLRRMQTHLAPEKWYAGFLEALYVSSYKDLVRDIDPDFYEKKQHNKEYSDMTHLGYIGDVGKETVTPDNTVVIEKINEFRDEIVRMLDFRSVADRLVPVVISSDKRDSLFNHNDNVLAVRELLDHVVKTGRGVEFVKCLEAAEYPYLACLLQRKYVTKHVGYCEKMLQIFSPSIQYQINVLDVISHLVAQDVLNTGDAELIEAEYRRRGNTAAATGSCTNQASAGGLVLQVY